MAAIIYFEKTTEDAEQVTYRYGPDQSNLDKSFVVSKQTRQPAVDPERASFGVQLALSGILKSLAKQGRWPERGAGYA